MNKTTRFILLIIILALCFYFGRNIDLDTTEIEERLKNFPIVLSSIAFVVLYVVITFFVWFVAKDVFRIASAVVYGPYLSALLIYLGEMCNAFVLFHLSRKLGQEYVVQKLGAKEDKLESSRENKGFLGNFTLRINLIPFRIQDLGAGLSTISFKKYLGAIAIASAPRIFVFQYCLFGLMSIFKDPEAFSQFFSKTMNDPDFSLQFMQDHRIIFILFLFYSLFVIIFTIYYFVNRSRQKVKAQLN